MRIKAKSFDREAMRYRDSAGVHLIDWINGKLHGGDKDVEALRLYVRNLEDEVEPLRQRYNDLSVEISATSRDLMRQRAHMERVDVETKLLRTKLKAIIKQVEKAQKALTTDDHNSVINEFYKQRQDELARRKRENFLQNTDKEKIKAETIGHKQDTQKRRIENIHRKLTDLTSQREVLEKEIQKSKQIVILEEQKIMQAESDLSRATLSEHWKRESERLVASIRRDALNELKDIVSLPDSNWHNLGVAMILVGMPFPTQWKDVFKFLH